MDETGIYYNSLLTVISLERTNLPLVAPRVYLTAAGNALPYNCATCYPHIDGLLEIGAAASYYWDVKQMAHIMSLLDPTAFKAFLAFVLGLPPVKGKPGFQASNGIDLFTGELFGAWYAFNSDALFTSIFTYIVTSGDTAFSKQSIRGKTVAEWLLELATHWKQYSLASATPPEPFLADYGSFAGDFLECVPTYTNTVPALQAANAWMLRRTAELALLHDAGSGGGTGGGQLTALEWHGEGNVSRWVRRLDDSSSAARLRRSAELIVNATLRRLWVEGGGGVWGCLNGANNTLTPVRTIVDFQAISHLIGSDLNSSVRKQMADFFVRELAYPCVGCHWPIALSREDGLKFIDRPDHGNSRDAFIDCDTASV